MNESPLNDIIFDSKIWKKDSQDEKEESSVFNDKSEIYKNKNNIIQNKKNKKNKNIKNNTYNNSYYNCNDGNSGGDSNNSENNNNFFNNNNMISNKQKSIKNNNNNTNNNNNNNNNKDGKKLTLPISSIPYSLKIKKELNKNNNKIMKYSLENKGILQNLPTYNYKSKEKNISLLEKIKEKVSNDKILDITSKAKINDILKNDNDKINNENNKSLNKEEKKLANNNINLEQTQNNNISESIKNNNDEFEEDEEFEDEQDNEIIPINKVASIDIKSNFMKNQYFSPINLFYSSSINSNNNSGESQKKQRCFTESDDSYNKSSLFDPPSGSSNNSGNTFLTANSYQGNKGDRYPYSSRFQFANPMNNQNNNINKNNNISNNYMLQMNPLERHIYSSNFNSNELVFKQPFSLNTSFYYINNKNNLFSSNSEPKEKQIINLDDIARGIEKRTTVMIRNVPIKYTVEVLEKELDYFNGKFDCLYMPFDYENGGNKGYAFLNLVNPYHVLLFYEVFQGKCWSFFESKKICELNFANFQGINEIKKHAKNYKGTKKPTFYINTNISNSSIEIPKKYLYLILEKNPNLNYYENKMLNTIIINSFN